MVASLGTVAFVGMGLIGGSLARALKKVQAADEVMALDTSKAALAEALALGVIDTAAEWADLARADVIVLSTPVDALFAVCRELAAVPLKDSLVLTDVGSTKSSVLDAVRQAFGVIPPWFVPGAS